MIKKYLFWIKKSVLGKDCLPMDRMDRVDYYLAIVFGTIGLPFTIIIKFIRIILSIN